MLLRKLLLLKMVLVRMWMRISIHAVAMLGVHCRGVHCRGVHCRGMDGRMEWGVHGRGEVERVVRVVVEERQLGVGLQGGEGVVVPRVQEARVVGEGGAVEGRGRALLLLLPEGLQVGGVGALLLALDAVQARGARAVAAQVPVDAVAARLGGRHPPLLLALGAGGLLGGGVEGGDGGGGGGRGGV